MLELPGVKFYLVGGCVRDQILDRPIKDRDYVVLTEMSFDELATAMEQAGVVIFVRKPEFLTIRARYKDEVFDVAFPRVDGEYKDGRRPESVSLASSLEQDAKRRDFTINAMYLGDDGKVIDFFDGQRDLNSKVIRAVGDPYKRFSEDYLRILRAVRFACTLDFSIERETYSAMLLQSGGLTQIAADRIREELNRALLANPERTAQELSYLGIFGLLREKGLSFETTLRDR